MKQDLTWETPLIQVGVEAMNKTRRNRLIRFLQEELAIPQEAVAIALRHDEGTVLSFLPMVLWQYGLVTLEQLDQIFDWLETA